MESNKHNKKKGIRIPIDEARGEEALRRHEALATEANDAAVWEFVLGDEDGGVIGHHAELIKPASSSEDRLGLDPLNHTEPMVRVDDLIADLKCHVAPT